MKEKNSLLIHITLLLIRILKDKGLNKLNKAQCLQQKIRNYISEKNLKTNQLQQPKEH